MVGLLDLVSIVRHIIATGERLSISFRSKLAIWLKNVTILMGFKSTQACVEAVPVLAV